MPGFTIISARRDSDTHVDQLEDLLIETSFGGKMLSTLCGCQHVPRHCQKVVQPLQIDHEDMEMRGHQSSRRSGSRRSSILDRKGLKLELTDSLFKTGGEIVPDEWISAQEFPAIREKRSRSASSTHT